MTQSAFGVMLAWDPSPDTNVVGSAVQYGTNSGSYQTRVDVGNQTNATIQLPTNGTTFFFVAIAYTVDGVESLPSNEVSYSPSATSTNQTITFGALAAKTFGNAAFPLNATASSGLPVSFSSGNPSVATLAGNTVTIVGAGSAVLTASQAGNSNYTAAANLTQTLTVNQATATVTLSGLSATYDGTAKSATATTSPNGLPVTITYNGSATAPVNAGSYAVVATVNHANYTGSASGTLTIAQPGQTITFGALAAKTFGDAAFPLSATASSGLPVSFSSENPSVATIAGNTVTIVGAGSAVITASQAGDGNYSAAANVPQTLTVNAIPTVMISADQGRTWVTLVGSSAFVGSWAITATAFATAGLGGQAPALGFTSFDATSRRPGTLMVRLYATGFQWGDPTSYYRSQVDGSVAGGSSLYVNTYVNAANEPFNTTAISADLLTSQGSFFAGVFNSGASNTTFGIPSGPFSMMFEATITQRRGGSVAFTNSLIATATPSPSGLPTTNTDSTSGTLTVAQPDQTITFGALAAKLFGGATFPLAATASSGLPVSFSSGNPSVATISSNTVTIVGAGTAVITASQAGDGNYSAAANVMQTLEVGHAPPGALLISQTPDGLNQHLRFSVGPGRHWQLQASADSLRWDTLCALDATTNGWVDVFAPITPSQPARIYRLVNAPTSTPNQAVDVLPGAVSLSRTDSPLNMQVRFSVGPNRHWQLQASADFLHWTILCELTAQANGWIDIFDPVIPSRPARFYRVASAPASP